MNIESRTSPVGSGRRVLVVDDDRDIRGVVSDVLRAEGYEVVTACDGLEALVVASQQHPDVILLDLMMPVMSGRQFRAEQSRDPTLARVPVVVMSAFPQTSDLGAAGYLSKPFDITELIETVEQCAG